MNAIKEIGARKTIRFIIYSLFQIFYHLIIDHFLFFPQSRKFILQLVGAKIAKDTVLMNVKFFNWHHKGPKGLKISKNCFIGDESLIDLYDSVILEDHVTIAQKVTVLTHTNVGYKTHPLQGYFPKHSKKVIFKAGCVVGVGSIILPGVTIGEKSFIGAGSVVTSNVPNNSLYTGIPAKLLRKLK